MSEGYGRANNKLRLHAGEYLSPEELRMDWQEAVNTMEALVSFYDDYCEGGNIDEHDRQDYETVQNAWARIKQG